jgi:hypothetical protein
MVDWSMDRKSLRDGSIHDGKDHAKRADISQLLHRPIASRSCASLGE